MTDRFDVAIVGAGHGGAQAAIALRQQGSAGTIALIGDEPELPYERPPLSKEYLSGEKTFERILIRPATFWQERGIVTRLGRRVDAVDPVAHCLILQGGAKIGYNVLIWATGGRPRRLNCGGNALPGVHAVRTRADVDRLSAELTTRPRVAVIGAGYIGLEAAAVLSKRGLSVTVLEAQTRVLARVAGEALSDFFAAEHRAHGVDLRLGVGVACLTGERRVTGVQLVDGEVIAADVVIVGIGIEPAVAPLLAAGARGGNGVWVDDRCRTSLADIYAVGDCALHANPYADGDEIRLESVQNANDMAVTAARAIAGAPGRYDAVPWFWSNQYDLKLQTVGLSAGHDRAVVRGDVVTRSFSVIYLRAGRVVALDCVNAVKDYVQGRKLVEARAVVSPAALADVATPLKALGPSAPAT